MKKILISLVFFASILVNAGPPGHHHHHHHGGNDTLGIVNTVFYGLNTLANLSSPRIVVPAATVVEPVQVITPAPTTYIEPVQVVQPVYVSPPPRYYYVPPPRRGYYYRRW